jgi:hypothetical protein
MNWLSTKCLFLRQQNVRQFIWKSLNKHYTRGIQSNMKMLKQLEMFAFIKPSNYVTIISNYNQITRTKDNYTTRNYPLQRVYACTKIVFKRFSFVLTYLSIQL